MPAAPPTADSDLLLVRRARGGDESAFADLYRRHVGRVYAVCLRLVRERGRAEELTQDAFVRCWERLDRYREESAFGTWLYRLAVNVVFEAGRKDRRRETRVAIATLPEGARQVFVLFDIEGYAHDEIAAMMGIAVGTSKAQLFRARRLLRDRLDA